MTPQLSESERTKLSIYSDIAIHIIEIEDRIKSLAEELKYAPLSDFGPLLDSLKINKMEAERLRNTQRDIAFHIRHVGGLPI